jgi:hypothetical protein
MTEPTPPMLTVDQLTQLKLRWERLGLVGVLDHLRPGLTDAEMDALTEPLGIVLPEEARVWSGWHDGTDPLGIDPIRGEEFAMLAPGRIFLSLGDAVKECQILRGLLREGYGSNDFWRQWQAVEHAGGSDDPRLHRGRAGEGVPAGVSVPRSPPWAADARGVG